MKGKRTVRHKNYGDYFEPTPEQLKAEIDSLGTVDNPLTDVPCALPSIAIVGRPNVGKSSLFNAILRRRHAIVHFESGVTRDRVSASGVFNGCRFNLIDTGGLGMYSGERKGVGFWDQMIASQVDAAVASSESIIFVVDAQAGMSPLDAGIAERIRSCGKKIILVANKTDTRDDRLLSDEFHELGFDKIYPVSCLHRTGIGDVIEAATKDFPKNVTEARSKRPLRIAVLGRPNVGKSSIVNRVLGEDRVIVSDVAGTTRDAIDVEFTLRCNDELVPAVLVDTAGLRKKSKVDTAVEVFSMMRASEALQNCDIVLFVIEASKGAATSQDKTIARMIEESGKGCVIVANKWDLRADSVKAGEMLTEIYYTLPKMKYAPVVFTSALNGHNFGSLYEAIAQVRAQMGIKISTSMLNRVVQDAIQRNLPPVVGTKPLKIYYGTMVSTTPPRFVLFVNKVGYCAESYRMYLINYFRKAFDFVGFPIQIRLEERERRDLSEVINHTGSLNKKERITPKQRKLDKLRKEHRDRKRKMLEDDDD